MPYVGMTNSETSGKVLGGYRLPQPYLCPDNIYNIMKQCWVEKSADRPTIKDIVDMLVINNNTIKNTPDSHQKISENDRKMSMTSPSYGLYHSSSTYGLNYAPVSDV